MNNLLKAVLTKDCYTHIRIDRKYGGHSNHIYMGVVMNDFQIHYTLDALMEEFNYPKLTGPIQIFTQKDGLLEEYQIAQYDVDD